MKQINIKIEDDLKKKLDFYCVEKDTKIAVLIREKIEEAVSHA